MGHRLTVKACLTDTQGEAVTPVQEVEMDYSVETRPSPFEGYDCVTTHMQAIEEVTFDVPAGVVLKGAVFALSTQLFWLEMGPEPFQHPGTYTFDPLVLEHRELEQA